MRRNEEACVDNHADRKIEISVQKTTVTDTYGYEIVYTLDASGYNPEILPLETMAGRLFAKKNHRKGLRSLKNLKPTEKGADLSKYAGNLKTGSGKSGSFWRLDLYNIFEATTLCGFDGNNKIYEKETCILVQDGSVNYQHNEYLMDYFIYLNGMKVGYYLTDYAGNGNLEGTASFYCLYDEQGNIVQISNKVGDVPYYLFRYDSYGNSLDIETNSNDSEMEPSGYKGYSESAIYFKTGARHYDPNTGTFISPDPFKGYMGDPQSQHPYMYCHGNPIRYSDPSGYWKWQIDGWDEKKAYLISEQGDSLSTLKAHKFPVGGMTEPKQAGERWDFTYLLQIGMAAGNLNKNIKNCNCAGTAYSWICNFKPKPGQRMDYMPSAVEDDLKKKEWCRGAFSFNNLQFGDVVSFRNDGKTTHFGIYLSGTSQNDTYILSQWGDDGKLDITNLTKVENFYGKAYEYFRRK